LALKEKELAKNIIGVSRTEASIKKLGAWVDRLKRCLWKSSEEK